MACHARSESDRSDARHAARLGADAGAGRRRRRQHRLIGRAGTDAYDSPEYGAAKAGLIRVTASVVGLRESVGVRVNCVAPHWIGLERAHAELAAMSPDERAAAPPFVDPEEIAEVVVWLVRDDSLAGRVVEMRGGSDRRLLETGNEER